MQIFLWLMVSKFGSGKVTPMAGAVPVLCMRCAEFPLPGVPHHLADVVQPAPESSDLKGLVRWGHGVGFMEDFVSKALME